MSSLSDSSRSGRSHFHQVVASFLAQPGLPFVDILSAERIERIFSRHGNLFGSGAIYSTALMDWSFLGQVLRDGKGASCQAVVAFLDDPHRFSHSKRVGAYFGLVPSQDQSGDRNRMGHITREGPAVVRHFLAEATWQAVRRSPTVRACFERIARGDKDRRKTAIVATAHYLVRVMWAMLKNGTLWQERAQAV